MNSEPGAVRKWKLADISRVVVDGGVGYVDGSIVARSLGAGERVLVVTSWYHVPRAKLALRRAGVAVAGGVGTPVRGYPKEAYGFLRELPAWLYYRLRADL